jgi:TonB family protein
MGDVILRVVIDEDGSVAEEECVRGNPLIGHLAEEAASRWKFQPILVDGQPARVESRLTFRIGK